MNLTEIETAFAFINQWVDNPQFNFFALMSLEHHSKVIQKHLEQIQDEYRKTMSPYIALNEKLLVFNKKYGLLDGNSDNGITPFNLFFDN